MDNNNKVDVGFTHPDYDSIKESWDLCRTVYAGAEAVKAAGSKYLPSFNANEHGTDYESYKSRAIFFEAMTRAVTGMLGILFAKDPTVDLKDDKHKNFYEEFSFNGHSLLTFLKLVSRELLVTGRVGLLVDLSESGKPYIVVYRAEDIINWRYEFIEGRRVATMVVLRGETDEYKNQYEFERKETYRVLRLTNNEYYQEVFVKHKSNSGDPSADTYESKGAVRILKSGFSLDFIPFYMLNVNGIGEEVVRPPLYGLATVNIGLYRNSADLEGFIHRMMPTPVLAGFGSNEKDAAKNLLIGSTTAFISTKADARAFYLESSGNGIAPLIEEMKNKQDMMSRLSLQLLEAGKKISESADNQRMRRLTENSILASLVSNINEGVTDALRFAYYWAESEVVTDGLSVAMSKDFNDPFPDARLVSELHALVVSNLLSRETLFSYLKKSGIVDANKSYESELDLLEKDDNKNFPDN